MSLSTETYMRLEPMEANADRDGGTDAFADIYLTGNHENSYLQTLNTCVGKVGLK